MTEAWGSAHAPTPDEAGFRAWAASRMTPLRRKAYLLSGDWHSADDLVQDTLVTVFAHWPRLAARGRPDAYASKVLVSRFLDDRRRPWRRESPTSDLPDREDDAARRRFAAAEGTDDLLAAALATLPATQRSVVVLRYADDLSLEEVARLLDLSVGTVKSRASRGTEALRAELASRGHHAAPAPADAPDVPDSSTPLPEASHER